MRFQRPRENITRNILNPARQSRGIPLKTKVFPVGLFYFPCLLSDPFSIQIKLQSFRGATSLPFSHTMNK